MSFINYSAREINCKVTVFCQGHFLRGERRHEYEVIGANFNTLWTGPDYGK